MQLVYSRNFAGTEQSVLTLSHALQAQGHEVWVAVKSGGSLAERYRGDGLSLCPVPLNSFFASWRLARYVREAKIDVIHSHLTEATGIGASGGKPQTTGLPSRGSQMTVEIAPEILERALVPIERMLAVK